MEKITKISPEICMIIMELDDHVIGSAIRAFIDSSHKPEGMAKVLCNMLEKKAQTANKRAKKQEWIFEQIIPVENSPYGDGRLHRLCLDYNKQNPNKYSADLYKEFLTYWTEPIQKGLHRGQERWAVLEVTWSVGGRLSLWSRNKKKFEAKPQKETKSDYLKNISKELDNLLK